MVGCSSSKYEKKEEVEEEVTKPVEGQGCSNHSNSRRRTAK